MNKSSLRASAEIISFIFHPVVFALCMPFLIIFRETHNIFYALKWQIFTSAFIFLGVVVIFMELIKGDFSDFDITLQKERLRFYIILLIIGVLYLSAASFLKGIFFFYFYYLTRASNWDSNFCYYKYLC